ncbi:hypothetical protein [Actinacidiphila acidipaludis]|uniref:Uncharacterized protein n=1 Tax=Actinacidiphila acidipaludis TaxID=2873382 RepID=A0ABS7Q996_9ACTN|nr:hypothetical protein [Streptomyces acidipaludis]MBY8879728.1 hypothetical protein [Streptomyces acidipaludis]
MNATCRIRGCDGRWHSQDMCDVVLADLGTTGVDLIAEVDAIDGGPVQLVVWEGEGRDLLRTSDPAAGHAFADRLRALAAAIDKGTALLPQPAPVEPVDYAARFAALDSDLLFELEDGGDCEDARRYVESLLMVLAEWRTRVMGLLAETPAEWAVPEAGAYQRALNRTREAWLQYGFRWQGGPALPWPFDLPEQAPAVAPAAPVTRIEAPGRRSLVLREVAA